MALESSPFTPEQLDNYARVLLWALRKSRRQKFQVGSPVLLRYDVTALPLAERVYKALMQARLNIILRGLMTPTMERDFFSLSTASQRAFVADGEAALMKSLDGNILLSAPASLTHLKDVDPKRISEVLLVRKRLRSLLDRKEEQGRFGWTLCTYTTGALAENARITTAQYTDQIIRACFLDEPDPVAKWEEIFVQAREIKKWINAMSIATINVQSAGTDLEISLGEKRRFIGLSGHNIPSFEIFTSPDWRGTRGTYYADQPSFRSGNYVSGVTLHFEKGRAVRSSAKEGDAFVRKTLKTDDTACQVGEFSLTDRRFSRIDTFMADTLYDENYGGAYGNCHIAVGSSYTDTYDGDPATLTKAMKKRLGYNDSALHWDLVNTEDKIVTVTLRTGARKVIYENGMFCY